MKKKYVALTCFLIAATVYFVFYHQNKTLKYVPENTDILVLVDTKKYTRDYISNYLLHPSQWMKKSRKNNGSASIKETGLKIPGFLQIFHLQNTPLSRWYSIFEIKDKPQLSQYLKQQKFVSIGNDVFKKDLLILKIAGEKCIIGTSDSAFEEISGFIRSGKKDAQADSFINGSLGSISFISGPRTRNFSIDIHENDIEVKNSFNTQNFDQVLSRLKNKVSFFDAELDAENKDMIAHLFGVNSSDAAGIEEIQATANLSQVNDTIITYGYDDHFNEIEKKTIRKIVQPDYHIVLQSMAPEKTIQYFRERKWINNQNQFTAIPFQPNHIFKNTTGVEIKSTGKPVRLLPKLNANYILIRNNPLWLSSLKTLSSVERKIISDTEYIFYANRDHDYYIKLQFKKDRLPLILRW